MEIPLNEQSAGGASYSPSVQFGITEGEKRIAYASADKERWLLEVRLCFIWDKLADQHPTLFRRRNYPLNPTQVAARLGLT